MKKLNQLFGYMLLAAIVLSSCKKQDEISDKQSSIQNAGNQNLLVATPAGLMPRSKVHLVENGFQLTVKGGHVLKTDTRTGVVAEDYGESHPSNKAGSSSLPTLINISAPSWVTWAQWDNPSTNPINNFSTSWVVPNNPATIDNQLIYIFNALENSTGMDIMQPVLQWGSSPAGGGNFWAIANWYVWDGGAAVSPLINVNPGTTIQGVIKLIGQNSDGSYSYSSSFTGYNNALNLSEGDVDNGVTIGAVPVQIGAFETLEVYQDVNGVSSYGIGQASNYPANTERVIMNNISLSLTTGYPSIGLPKDPVNMVNWATGTLKNTVGETTTVLNSNDAGQGQVALNFHPVPTINGATGIEIGFSQNSVPCVISAYPGTTVTVDLNVIARLGGSGTETFAITTPGVTFSGGNTSFTSTNSNVSQTFIMPASGTINGSGTLTILSNGSVTGAISVN
jgi:hypothetical protein